MFDHPVSVPKCEGAEGLRTTLCLLVCRNYMDGQLMIQYFILHIKTGSYYRPRKMIHNLSVYSYSLGHAGTNHTRNLSLRMGRNPHIHWSGSVDRDMTRVDCFKTLE